MADTTRPTPPHHALYQVLLRLVAALLLGHTGAQAVVNGTLASDQDAVARSAVMVACVERQRGTERLISSASGVVVGPGLVLTAAHIFSMCKHGPRPTRDAVYRWELRFGISGGSTATPAVVVGPADLLNEDLRQLMVPLHIRHETFRDYAFVRVPGGVPPGAQPMRLATTRMPLAVGMQVLFSGYGFTSAQGGDHRLRTAQLRLTSVDAALPGQPPIDPHLNAFDQRWYLDFMGRDQHPCLGDSGGPYYVLDGGEPVLLGVLTHLQKQRPGQDFCAVPSIGLRTEAFAAELGRLLRR